MKRVALLCLIVLTALTAIAAPKKRERWGIKTSLPDGTKWNRAKTVKFPEFAATQALEDVKQNDSRWDAKRITEAANGQGWKEGQVLRFNGFVTLVAWEKSASGDGDYHIQVADSPTSAAQCVIVEAPDPDRVDDATVKERATVVREFVRAKLLKGKDPGSSGNLLTHPAYVTVQGQLFYDDSHKAFAVRGKKGCHAVTGWELHPLVDMKFAPKPQG